MSRFDEIREAAIQLRVNRSKREFESKVRAAMEDATLPTFSNPLGTLTSEQQALLVEALASAEPIYKQRETLAVDAKLLKFLEQDERDKEDSLKKEYAPLKHGFIGGIAKAGLVEQAYNKEGQS